MFTAVGRRDGRVLASLSVLFPSVRDPFLEAGFVSLSLSLLLFVVLLSVSFP